MKIGLLGVAINNKNMGCVALTYSIIKMLENVSREINIDLDYVIFDEFPDNSKTKKMCEQLNIDIEKIQVVKEGRYGSYKRIVWHVFENIYQIYAIKQCDFVIDITQGDSFTDIYGKRRFNNYTRMKELVLKLGIPLILGPQTYGPYLDLKTQKYAKKIIERASLIIARDQESIECLKLIGIDKVKLTTDLAFTLPYERTNYISNKIKVGINISGLLVKNKTESTLTNFVLNTNYDSYIIEIIKWLIEENKYEVHAIPHVKEDYTAIRELLKENRNVIVHEPFDSPIEAKNCIAGMDIFIGARMHATIASFSSGVATIPVAYSRKFLGLFKTLGYDYVIDLQALDTTVAVCKTIQYIESWELLQNVTKACSNRYQELSNRNYELMRELLFHERKVETGEDYVEN